MPRTSSNFVPNSIQRIRTFLNEVCGMKVRPWAGVPETVEALHQVLLARRDCALFWKSLHVLLERLAQDLRRREHASTDADAIVDNEVLSSDAYAALLEEIKAALAPASPSSNSFVKLAAAVSAPAAGLLLLLAGASTAGCESHRTLSVSRLDASAIVAEPPPEADGPSLASMADGSATTSEPDGASYVPVADGSQAQKQDGRQPDGMIALTPTTPDAGPDITPRRCDGGCSLEDIMSACGIAPATRQSISACVERLNASWREGLTAGFATRSCDTISAVMGPSCLSSYCQPGKVSTSDFIASVLDCREPPIYPVYVGVRFA
jgi:hypothetical protein